MSADSSCEYAENYYQKMAQTIPGLLSKDWRERLQAEWAQLNIRMEALDAFRDRFRDDKIDFKPKWSERLLCDQLRAMRMYRDTLLAYAQIEGVELDKSLYNDDYMWDWVNTCN